MFKKYTQKAIDVVQSAQNYAIQFNHKKVMAAHILMGLVFQSKGVQAKILNFDKIDFGKLTIELQNLNLEKGENIVFSAEAKDILKSSVDLSENLNSKFIMPQHIALALFLDKNTTAYQILKNLILMKKK